MTVTYSVRFDEYAGGREFLAVYRIVAHPCAPSEFYRHLQIPLTHTRAATVATAIAVIRSLRKGGCFKPSLLTSPAIEA